MKKFNVETSELYQLIKQLQQNGCGFQTFDDKEYNGHTVTINNKKLVNFASCSYLGLEKHPKLIEATISAVKHYGTQNSMSRAILSSPLHNELESCLSDIFPGTPIVFASTTLAHYSSLPILVGEKDAIILDAFVHSSVRTASMLCKANGSFVLISKHNDMEHVKYLIKRLKKEGYQNIWYCADGIYSMHGDVCDVKGLQTLLDEEENFFAYVDDAHGVGWCGKNGTGYVIGNFGLHEKMIVAGSMSKSIGVSGGFLIVPDKTLGDYLKVTGHTYIFSIPIPPANLGGLIASLKLHLTEEIAQYQLELAELINYFRQKCCELELSIYTKDYTPIQLLKIGDMDLLFKVQKQLINNGFYSSLVAYPSVAHGDEGLRISLTRHITKTDIDSFLQCIKSVLNEHHFRQLQKTEN